MLILRVWKQYAVHTFSDMYLILVNKVLSKTNSVTVSLSAVSLYLKQIAVVIHNYICSCLAERLIN